MLLLGRPAQAVPLIQDNLKRFAALHEDANVSYSFENLVDALTLLGRLSEARAEAEQGIVQARTVRGDYFREVILMCHLATILRLQGEVERASDLYERAEKIQLAHKKRRLTSAIGYRYTAMRIDLAGSPEQLKEALDRAEYARQWSRAQQNPADAGRDGINVARAMDALGQTVEARGAIDDAVATLRGAHRADYLAEALLARATLVSGGDLVGTDSALLDDDLAACADLVEVGGLLPLQGELQLLRASIALRRQDLDAARACLAKAEGIARRCGIRSYEARPHRLGSRL